MDLHADFVAAATPKSDVPVTPAESVVCVEPAQVVDTPKDGDGQPDESMEVEKPAEKLTRKVWAPVSVITVPEARLLLQAKARLYRMCQPKKKRKDLESPDWLKTAWQSGNKSKIAALLVENNFDKALAFSLELLIFSYVCRKPSSLRCTSWSQSRRRSSSAWTRDGTLRTRCGQT